MTAVGNILVSRVDEVTSRYISFGMPGFSMWEGLCQPDHYELTQTCFGGEAQKGRDFLGFVSDDKNRSMS